MKTCNRCSELKAFSDFGKHSRNSDGLRSECKPCAKLTSLNYRLKNRDILARKSRTYHSENREKVSERSKSYYRSNRQSALATCKAWREKNVEKCRLAAKIWALSNSEKRRAYRRKWREKYPDKSIAATRNWQKKNPERCRAIAAKRRAAFLQRVPSWLSDEDFEVMQAMYACAQMTRIQTGEVYHVDHILPLQGKYVSGLHVPSNLQIITGIENLSKNNRWLPS